jgi:NurA-like 5'-3' nuclease
MAFMGRPDIQDFQTGTIYRNSLNDELVEYLGLACMPELAGEDVAIFRSVEGGGLFVATKQGYNQGETFEEIGEAMADEIALGEEPGER